jgi:hypothetical protein
MSVLKAGLRSAAISIENETVSVAYNGAFVQSPPTHRPTSVGFFVPGGRQKGGDWSTSALVRDFTRSHPYERATSLPIEKFQRGTLWIFADAKIRTAGNALYVSTQKRKCVGGFNGAKRKKLNIKSHLDTLFGLVRIGCVSGQ